jgi:hypothetical protein
MFSHPTLLAFASWFIPGAALFAVAVSAILLAQCEIYPELWRGVGEARRGPAPACTWPATVRREATQREE